MNKTILSSREAFDNEVEIRKLDGTLQIADPSTLTIHWKSIVDPYKGHEPCQENGWYRGD